jgi:putative phosphoesterase
MITSYKIGVISDTHIPDRTPELDPDFINTLNAEKVDLILHAGDISVQRVLNELEKIAPVMAVRGNRDFLLGRKIPMTQHFEKFGVKFALMHGHMNFFTYWIDKILYVFQGYNRDRYVSRLPVAAPEARVFIFGHTHHAENFWQDGKLFFNPGSITYGDRYLKQRSWGMLEVHEDGRVESRIIPWPVANN